MELIPETITDEKVRSLRKLFVIDLIIGVSLLFCASPILTRADLE